MNKIDSDIESILAPRRYPSGYVSPDYRDGPPAPEVLKAGRALSREQALKLSEELRPMRVLVKRIVVEFHYRNMNQDVSYKMVTEAEKSLDAFFHHLHCVGYGPKRESERS